MITLNQPITIAETQTFHIAKIEIDFENGIILVHTKVKNEKGETVSTLQDTYQGPEALEYWTNFNSKEFAYEKMVEKNNIDVPVENISDVLVEDEEIPE